MAFECTISVNERRPFEFARHQLFSQSTQGNVTNRALVQPSASCTPMFTLRYLIFVPAFASMALAVSIINSRTIEKSVQNDTRLHSPSLRDSRLIDTRNDWQTITITHSQNNYPRSKTTANSVPQTKQEDHDGTISSVLKYLGEAFGSIITW
jgi:hypothetical protein